MTDSPQRGLKGNVFLFLKGMAMGAADLVPGVSGGTIAFISGIYEELLSGISGLKLSALRDIKKSGLSTFWKKVNGPFFLVLLLGIFTSIALFASLIEHLLETQPIPVWSFFFGLVVASVFMVGKKVKNWGFSPIIALIVGAVVAYFVTEATPVGEIDSLPYLFMCGAVAITAMILPGISGSFILLLLGAYTTVLSAVSGAVKAVSAGDTSELGGYALKLFTFAAGCLVGLLGFSRLLNWLFKHAYDITVAVLTGFLIGSLNKLWPWKETLEVFVKHAGEPNEEIVPMVQQNILPQSFEQIVGLPSQLWVAIALCAAGAAIIFVLDRFAPDEE